MTQPPASSRFLVIDVQPTRRCLVLRDRAGQYHVLRTYDPLPVIGDTFSGDAAGLGPALISPAAGRGLHVVFERVDCGQLTAMQQLHASPPD